VTGAVAAAPVLLAAALLAVPVPPVAVLRLAAVLPRRTGPVRRRRLAFGPRQAAAAAAVTLFAAVGAGLTPAPAAAAALVAAASVRAIGRHTAGRLGSRERAAAIDAVAVLGAELRAGQQPVAALVAAQGAAPGPVAGVLHTAATAATLGGSAAAVLREAAGCTPAVAADLRRVAAGWQLAEITGASLATVVGRAERAARDRLAQHRRVAALLAGPRATAALLAGLPVLGLGLGTAMGGHPLAVLVHTTGGQLALLAGVLLELAGLGWTRRIVHAAERSERGGEQ
jgi:tight adherence protein B